MENRTFYNEILTEHNKYPSHKHGMIQPRYSHEGVNPSCGDDIILNLNALNNSSNIDTIVANN